MRLLTLLAFTWAVAWVPMASAEEADPAAKWLTVYGWIQTADRLAGAGQWPLALGSYLEADRQIKALAVEHPDFEQEMVNYRRNALAATIAETEARLTTDEHEVMMKYLDFIESLELGEAQRYADEYEAAYGTLGMAKAVLDEIIDRKPEEFREAVASQYARLESSLTWLDSQINFSAMSRPAVAMDGSIDWGTTKFVKAADLPKTTDGAVITADLFPRNPAAVITGLSTGDGGAGDNNLTPDKSSINLTPPVTAPMTSAEMSSGGADSPPQIIGEPTESGMQRDRGATSAPPLRFRMSSRQTGIPEPLEPAPVPKAP